ncbi:hypothetical protein HELRODRAFT_171372 [Helobdella robusta]|uniref:RNA polymerase II subunit B1 CTD phosphatase RPAP2 homolog n=1 Tax=Helobdella robusta TaxID=6412 RepID=T1F471_HELRO|nr:hypothetical protein HELRODRAFT_171372 [Helobdella robusta]ESO05710.1 hypothetical protein HELRODRAFT_171372 [Helobdella robusta]
MISSKNKIVHPSVAAERQMRNQMQERFKMKKELELKSRKFVEFLSINQHVNEDELSTMLHLLFVQQYDDVIVERSISSFCGYALCAADLIEVPKKKYHISHLTSTVYDIEERKKFCSNNCFLSSKHLRKQISADPLLDRTRISTKFDYLRDHSNFKKSDGMGDVVLQPFRFSLADEIKKMSICERDDGDDDDGDDDDGDDDGDDDDGDDDDGDDDGGDDDGGDDDGGDEYERMVSSRDYDYDDDKEKNKKDSPIVNVEKKKKAETRGAVLLQNWQLPPLSVNGRNNLF